jgi:hypothetical protein
VHLLPFEAFPPPIAAVAGRVRPSAGPRHRSDRFQPRRSPRTLPPHPFSGPRGFAPSSGPLPAWTLPSVRARFSRGLIHHVKDAPKSGFSV